MTEINDIELGPQIKIKIEKEEEKEEKKKESL